MTTLRVNKLTRAWCGFAFAPLSVFSAIGYYYQADPEVMTLFRVLDTWIPLWVWAWGWLVAGIFHLVVAFNGSTLSYRLAISVGTGLAFGQFVASLWSRYVEDAPLTYVGLAWAYFILAIYGLVLGVLIAGSHSRFWVE